MTSQMSLRRLPVAAAFCAALLFSLPACAEPSAVADTASEAPATVEKNATTGIARITLSQRAIERLELRTEPVRQGPEAALAIPYAALLYQADGKTWVYTNPEPRVYERQALTVVRVEAGVVTASSGPAVGTQVVTVGGPELFGAEFNTGK
jgi:hypothetical protein